MSFAGHANSTDKLPKKKSHQLKVSWICQYICTYWSFVLHKRGRLKHVRIKYCRIGLYHIRMDYHFSLEILSTFFMIYMLVH